MRSIVTDLGECPICGKIRYTSRKRAKEVARTIFPTARHLSEYKCAGYWHIGNLPRAVIRGADRATLRPTKKRPRLQKGTKRYADENDEDQESA